MLHQQYEGTCAVFVLLINKNNVQIRRRMQKVQEEKPSTYGTQKLVRLKAAFDFLPSTHGD
jgi:hypothetical protein